MSSDPEPRLLDAAGLVEIAALMNAMGGDEQVIALELGKIVFAHPMEPGSFGAELEDGPYLEISGADPGPNGGGDFFLHVDPGLWQSVVRPGHSVDLLGPDDERYCFLFLEPNHPLSAVVVLLEQEVAPIASVIADKAKGKNVLVLHRRPGEDVVAHQLPAETLSVSHDANREKFTIAGGDFSLDCRVGECRHASGSDAVDLYVGDDHYTLWFVSQFVPAEA